MRNIFYIDFTYNASQLTTNNNIITRTFIFFCFNPNQKSRIPKPKIRVISIVTDLIDSNSHYFLERRVRKKTLYFILHCIIPTALLVAAMMFASLRRIRGKNVWRMSSSFANIEHYLTSIRQYVHNA